MQVVGKSCTVCSARIAVARDGAACPTCGAALHAACGPQHTCAHPSPPAAAPAPPPARRRHPAALIGGALGIVVAAAALPMLRSSGVKRQVAARAADDLRCPADQVEVSLARPISARGCGRTIRYTQVCGDLDRRDCLEWWQDAQPGR